MALYDSIKDGDSDIALIYDGLLRAIQNQSNADFAYDSAIENTATFCFGAWRIKTDYENELSFNQVIKIDRIADPLNVYFDKNAEQPDYSDANHVTVLVKMTKDEFKARWPKAEVSNFDYYDKEWLADDCVIVAEHFKNKFFKNMSPNDKINDCINYFKIFRKISA